MDDWWGKNLLKICYSTNTMRTLAKIVKINCFKTLKINQRLTTIGRAFIQ